MNHDHTHRPTATAAAALMLGFSLTGCAGPGMMSSVSSDLRDMLKDPSVQKTLTSWSAQADCTNPEISVFTKTSAGAELNGVIIRGGVAGAGSAISRAMPYLFELGGLSALAAILALVLRKRNGTGAPSGAPPTTPANPPTPA